MTMIRSKGYSYYLSAATTCRTPLFEQGAYVGACIRVDESTVIKMNIDQPVLRIVRDKGLLASSGWRGDNRARLLTPAACRLLMKDRLP